MTTERKKEAPCRIFISPPFKEAGSSRCAAHLNSLPIFISIFIPCTRCSYAPARGRHFNRSSASLVIAPISPLCAPDTIANTYPVRFTRERLRAGPPWPALASDFLNHDHATLVTAYKSNVKDV